MQLHAHLTTPFQARKAHAAERWARAVVGVVGCSHDPKTIAAWGHCIGASGGALRAWCRAAHVPSKASLDFARLLRAFVQSDGGTWDLQNILDVVDERTLRHLLDRAGLTDVQPYGSRPPLDNFLRRQTLIRHAAALQALDDLLASGARGDA